MPIARNCKVVMGGEPWHPNMPLFYCGLPLNEDDYCAWGHYAPDNADYQGPIPKRTNAEWAAFQITKHGVDRYLTPQLQFNKLVEEIGELAKEVNRALRGPISSEQEAHKIMEKVRGETADVALALYNLAAKFQIDLDLAIQMKVELDTRNFRPTSPPEVYGSVAGFWIDNPITPMPIKREDESDGV